jgi:hypothetical protein
MATEINITPSTAHQAYMQNTDSIPEMLLQWQQAMRDRAKEDRASKAQEIQLSNQERRLLMEEANHKHNTELRNKTEKAQNILNKWTSEGYNYDLLSGSDARAAYSPLGNIPDYSANWKGYQEDMRSIGSSANPTVFHANKMASDKMYVDAIANRFEADARAFRNFGDNNKVNQSELNTLLNKELHADNVYNQYAQVYGSNAALQRFAEIYSPEISSPNVIDKLNQFINPSSPTSPYSDNNTLSSSDIVNQASGLPGMFEQRPKEEGVNPRALAFTGGLGAAIGTEELIRRSYGSAVADATKPVMKDIRTAWKAPKAGGMDWKTFKETYNMNKGDAGGKGKKFKASDSIKKQASRMARPSVWPTLKSVPAYAATTMGGEALGAEVGSMFGGKGEDVGREVGGIAGTVAAPAVKNAMTNVYKKISQKGLPWAIKKIATKAGPGLAMKMLGKGAVGAMSGPFTGGAGTAFMGTLIAKDIYDIADILLTEE